MQTEKITQNHLQKQHDKQHLKGTDYEMLPVLACIHYTMSHFATLACRKILCSAKRATRTILVRYTVFVKSSNTTFSKEKKINMLTRDAINELVRLPPWHEHQYTSLLNHSWLLNYSCISIQMHRLQETLKTIHINLFHSLNIHINANLARWLTLIP